VYILSNLGALGLIQQNLSLVLSGSSHARNFQFLAEFILVWDSVVGKVVAGSDVLEDHAVLSVDAFAVAILSLATSGLDSPDGIVCFSVVDTNFLVARVASESHRGKRQRIQVQFLVAEAGMSADTHVLAILNRLVGTIVSMFNSEDGASACSLIVASSSHSIGVAGDHLLIGVSHKHGIGAAGAQHDIVTRLKIAIFSVSEGCLLSL